MNRKATIAALCAAVSLHHAQAAEPQSDTAAYELGAVIASGSAPGPNAQAVGQDVTTITADQIQAQGARSLSEALSVVPGLIVTPAAQGVPRIILRGLPPRHTQLFLNGIPLNAAYDGQFDPSLIPVEDIDHIKIIAGNSSVLYGPDTTGAVIDIITKTGRSGFHGTAQGEIGSAHANYETGSLFGGSGANDFFVSTSHQSASGYLLPSGSTRKNSDTSRENVFANAGTKLGDWQIGIVYSHLNGSEGLPSNTLASGTNAFSSGQTFNRLSAISGDSGSLDASYDKGGPLTLRLTGYVNTFNETSNRYDDANYDSMSNPNVQTFHEYIDTTISGGQLQANYDFGDAGALTASFQLRNEQDSITGAIRNVPVTTTSTVTTGGGTGAGSGSGRGRTTTTTTTTTYAFQTLDATNSDTTYSPALEYRVTPFTNFHVTAGYSHHWFAREGGAVDHGDQWMLGTRYDIAPTVQIFGSYSRKIRFPTLQELYDPQMGNAALRPERSDDVEGGATWRPTPTTRLQVSGFHNAVANFIQNNATTQIFTNQGVTINGGEATASWNPWAPLQLITSYTFLDTRNSQTGYRVSNRPRDIGQLQMVYTPVPTWTLYGSASVYADQIVASNSNPALTEALPNYVVVSGRLAKAFPEYGAEIYIRGTNLLNAHYVNAVGYPAAGRTIYGGTSLKF